MNIKKIIEDWRKTKVAKRKAAIEARIISYIRVADYKGDLVIWVGDTPTVKIEHLAGHWKEELDEARGRAADHKEEAV